MNLRKCLTTICFVLTCFCALAQTDLYVDGHLLAHDIEPTEATPPALRELMKGRWMNLQQSSGQTSRRQVKAQWRQAASRANTSLVIAPLLKSVRSQDAPFNDLCPRWTYDNDSVSEERCLSGCVATCIEQVMSYYRYPEALLDTLRGWTTDHYVIEDLLPGTRFDWDNYLLDYRNGWTAAQGQAAALPSLAAGMAVHMNYGLSSSGANVSRAIEPLQQAFGYGLARFFDRILYTPDRWHALLQHELSEGRPIAYVGSNMSLSGHAFNIDGIDERGFYHVNWGYNGSYDGWYDLDWLCPWEPLATVQEGFAAGFFCNQGALFMHPSAEAQPLAADTLQLDSLGVSLREIIFQREPDIQGYVPADFRFENTSEDEVTYTYEVMTYLPTDTAIFEQANYVGLSGLTLPPHATRTQRVYLRFTKAGDRLLGISHDDVTIPFTQPVKVHRGTAPQLAWETPDVEFSPQADGTVTARFSIPVSNLAAAGFAAPLVICCLYPDGFEDENLRHFLVPTIPGGGEEALAVSFERLIPNQHYTFLVRCPWEVQAQVDFTTPKATSIDAVSLKQDASNALRPFYDLSGRPVSRSYQGLRITRNRKILIPLSSSLSPQKSK